ncbi:MAG TPA: CoA transferase [Longimicrobiales bacterium]|nr:CoA transferase [Longimicrobiales bacterium]
MSVRPRPLAGIRVVDLSQNIAGPFCTQILADLGADVVKVEPPGGDPAREWAPPQWGADGTMFLSVNRGKRSITLDLKRDDARAVLDALVARADIFVESFRRGVAERLGCGAEALRERHPALIYGSVRAYGADGPLADLAGYDALAQAHGGLISVTGQPDAPARVGTSVVDYGTGTWAALAILAALRERDQSGQGTHVVAALYETAIGYNAYHLMGYFADGTVPQRHGTGFPAIAPYGAFAAADGELMIAGANDALFQKLCAALDLDSAAREPRWQTNPQRVADEATLRAEIERVTRQLPVATLEARLRTAGVPCAAIRSIDQVADEPQTSAGGLLHATPRDDAPALRGPLPPLRWNGARAAADRPPPHAGEHTQQILEELGFAPNRPGITQEE